MTTLAPATPLTGTVRPPCPAGHHMEVTHRRRWWGRTRWYATCNGTCEHQAGPFKEYAVAEHEADLSNRQAALFSS